MRKMIPTMEQRLFHWPLAALTCIFLTISAHAQYQKEIDDWHAKRIQSLRADGGWLNLVGLYWLEEGKNSFGSAPGNKLVFPAGTIPETAGYFQRNGDNVILVAENNTPIQVNNKPVKETLIYAKDSSARPPVVSCGSLRWTVIRRDDRIGVRLRDLKSPQLAAEISGPAAFHRRQHIVFTRRTG